MVAFAGTGVLVWVSGAEQSISSVYARMLHGHCFLVPTHELMPHPLRCTDITELCYSAVKANVPRGAMLGHPQPSLAFNIDTACPADLLLLQPPANVSKQGLQSHQCACVRICLLWAYSGWPVCNAYAQKPRPPAPLPVFSSNFRVMT